MLSSVCLGGITADVECRRRRILRWARPLFISRPLHNTGFVVGPRTAVSAVCLPRQSTTPRRRAPRRAGPKPLTPYNTRAIRYGLRTNAPHFAHGPRPARVRPGPGNQIAAYTTS